MAGSVLIPRRFNGPVGSGHGGYCCGAFARFVGERAEVTLRRPVPLDTDLEVEGDGNGATRVLDGSDLVAEARPVPEFSLHVPAPPSLNQARRATSRYRGSEEGPFSRCFVCGRAREDAFGVFAGEVEGRDLLASPWTPPPWAAAADGQVRPEFVWAVLDCPASFAAYIGGQMPLSFLARLTANVAAPVRAGEEHVVIAWPIETEGRKRHSASAVVAPDGAIAASARALLIEPRRS
jgi:hypothetical protein